ncbi:hypothetical protein SDC9_186065 [bioreactor metagenome]|uniref:Uncharacterized protein n=1 Tax=bioreactor metagenome TaxID=1076179 RepID=A0A645HHN8_9ZZZZ
MISKMCSTFHAAAQPHFCHTVVVIHLAMPILCNRFHNCVRYMVGGKEHAFQVEVRAVSSQRQNLVGNAYDAIHFLGTQEAKCFFKITNYAMRNRYCAQPLQADC